MLKILQKSTKKTFRTVISRTQENKNSSIFLHSSAVVFEKTKPISKSKI